MSGLGVMKRMVLIAVVLGLLSSNLPPNASATAQQATTPPEFTPLPSPITLARMQSAWSVDTAAGGGHARIRGGQRLVAPRAGRWIVPANTCRKGR